MPTYSTHAFSEKVALITDGDNPFGRAIALQLALYGTFVIIGFSKEDSINRSAVQELRSLGTLAGAFEADITGVAGAKKLVGEVEKMFGRLDLLINTLKYRSDSSFIETSEETWNKTVDINLKSAFFVTQEAIRLMENRPKPRIVNLAFAEKKNVAGGIVRAGLIGLTKMLADEFAPKFRINCVEVGQAKDYGKKPEELDAELFRPRPAIAEDDVARAVLFLLSSEANCLNGQVLTVS